MKKFSFLDRIKSFKYAFTGFSNLFKNEHNARVHLVLTLVVILLGVLLKINSIEWSLIVMAIGIVFIAELLNTAIEKLADFVEPNTNKTIGEIKDYGAAAVLTAALVSIVLGSIVFIPKLIQLVLNLNV